MEGLIKGLMDVALGVADKDEESGRDERSRSTWAQVSTHSLPPLIFVANPKGIKLIGKMRRWCPGSRIMMIKRAVVTVGMVIIEQISGKYKNRLSFVLISNEM